MGFVLTKEENLVTLLRQHNLPKIKLYLIFGRMCLGSHPVVEFYSGGVNYLYFDPKSFNVNTFLPGTIFPGRKLHR